MSGKQARHRGKRQPDPPPPPDLALPEADCQAAAPGIGRLNACHALKFIALTFAVMSIAFSADLISVFPAGAAPAAADSGGGGGGDAAAEQNWKPMAGERLQVVKPVVKQQESNAPVAASAAAAAPAAAEPMPEMDAAPRSEPTMDYGLPKDHPYTPPEERQKTSLARPLRTADYYANYAGGVLHAAPRANVSDDDAIMTRRAHPNGPKRGWPEGVFRTHTADPDPIVATFDDFLSQEDAHRVIDAALPQMRRAGVTADNGGSRTSAGRSNDLTWLQHDHPAVKDFVERVSALVGVPATHAEQVQVVHYTKDQQYRKHWDAFDRKTERGQKMMRQAGNRILTALIYLQTPEEGGETDMVNLGLRIEPLLGRLLVFHNCHVGSETRHTDSNHAARPVLAGEKWAMNLWFRERPLRAT